MADLEHGIRHAPSWSRGKNSRLILPLTALLAYAGCTDLPKPTRFDDEPKAEYVSNAPDYGSDLSTAQMIEILRTQYNTLPDATSIPFEQAYQSAELRHQRAAKPAGISDINLEYRLASAGNAAKPLATDLSWMPFLKRDFNRTGSSLRRVDYDDFFAFVDAFGSSRGDSKYDTKFDLNGDGVVDFDDFFRFVDGFGVVQEGIDVRAAPTITAQLEVAIPAIPGITYSVGNDIIQGTTVGDSLVVNVDVPQELYGQPVRLEVVGYNTEGEPIKGGLWRGDMPNFWYNGPLSSNGMAEWVMNGTLPPKVWLYVEVDPNTGYHASFNDYEFLGFGPSDIGSARQVNGSRAVDMLDYTPDFLNTGRNFFRLREQPTDGRIYRVVISDTDKLVAH